MMAVAKKSYSFIPYSCIYIDAEWRDFLRAIEESIMCDSNPEELKGRLRDLWSASNSPNYILPCLSVRSGFDLYLQLKDFPPGSEIIVSAINIPSMAQIITHHGLRIVPLDVSIETVFPKVELLPALITPKTVAILVAHLYGKRCPMDPIIKIAQRHRIVVIEDSAESFDGLDNLCHPHTDLALFSFGVIKFFTSFGGAMALIRDKSDYEHMEKLQLSYPVQSRSTYLHKVLKYCALYFALECKTFMKMAVSVLNYGGVDYQNAAVRLLRGFPDKLIQNIRHQPSVPLLSMMLYRQSNIDPDEILLQRKKGRYVESRLPPELEMVGKCAEINNYWLFPILVDNPDNYVATIKALGIEVYRGATQLNLIETNIIKSEGENFTKEEQDVQRTKELFSYPHEAKYLIDHVVYLPISKRVPYSVLDHIIEMAKMALCIIEETKVTNVRPSISSKL